MVLTTLKLFNWRTYNSLEIEFDPKLNVILGENGSGKTNLVEAIYFLSMGRSWRTSNSEIMICKGETNSSITGQLKCGLLNKEIEINLTPQGKKVLINKKNIKGLSELTKSCNVILFSPSDVPLFLESPSDRRDFLDISISKIDGSYLEALKSYNNLLNQRNTLLKDERIDLDLLSVLTSQLVLEGIKITKRRYSYIEKINKILPKIVNELLGRAVNASIEYQPFVTIDEQMEVNAIAKLKDAQQTDLRVQHTTVGPHKEDIKFLLDGIDLGSYGSQGQNRICVLALKLTPYFLVEDEGEKPIVVLDDVTSELDETISSNLLKFIKQLSQVFITTTNLNVDGASIIDVASHTASRRN